MGRKLMEAEMLEYQERRKKSLEKSSVLLGISVDEIERLEAKARAELENEGNDWEKELDEKNKARAGITVSENAILKKRKTPNLPIGVSKLHNFVFSEDKMKRAHFENSTPPEILSTLCVMHGGKLIFSKQIPYYCHACGISENGKYVAFQTANGIVGALPQFLLYELANLNLLLHKTMPTGWKDLIKIEINELSKSIKLHYAFDFVEYDLNGNAICPEQVINYRIKYGDAYVLEQVAMGLIANGKFGLSSDDEQKILYILDEINECIYPNRLSFTFKALGECYEANGMKQKALLAYKMGLERNPTLSVKKAIKRLTPLK